MTLEKGHSRISEGEGVDIRPPVEPEKPAEVPVSSQEGLDNLRDDVEHPSSVPPFDGASPVAHPESLPEGKLGKFIKKAIETINAEYTAEEQKKQETAKTGFFGSIGNIFGRFFSAILNMSGNSYLGYGKQCEIKAKLLQETSESDRQTIIAYLKGLEQQEKDKKSVVLRVSYLRTQIEESIQWKGKEPLPQERIAGLKCQVGQVIAWSIGEHMMDRFINMGYGSEHAGIISKTDPLTVIHYTGGLGGKVVKEPFEKALSGRKAYQIAIHNMDYDGPKAVEYMEKQIQQQQKPKFDVATVAAQNAGHLEIGESFKKYLTRFQKPKDESFSCTILVSRAIQYAKTGSEKDYPDVPNGSYFASLLGVERNIVVRKKWFFGLFG